MPIELGEDELPRAKDAYHYIADPRILGHLDKLERTAATMLQPISLPTFVREEKVHVEPEDWRAGYLSVHDYWISDELTFSLRQNVPQALLRDLYRPLRESFVWYDREVQVSLDFAGTQALREANAARKIEPLPVVEPVLRAVHENQAVRRWLTLERWLPHHPDEADHPKVSVLRYSEGELEHQRY
jgi:hypothetical protein